MMLQVHELKGQELREPVSKETMEAQGLKNVMVFHIDGETEFDILTKIKEWINSVKE